MVTVADLKQEVGRAEKDQLLLFCPKCGEENSANAGDYWALPGDFVFKCCGEPVKLVRKVIRYEEVRP